MTKSYARGVIIDKNAPEEAKNTLKELNITPILSAEIPNIISEVATHPDMQIHPVNENTFICEPTVYDYYREALAPFSVEVLKGDKSIGLTYPDDVAYNVARIGQNVVHNTKHMDNAIHSFYEKNNQRIINVNQGYSKCSICNVGDNAVITTDEGVGRTLGKYGIDVLIVTSEGIYLNEKNNGFIGGTCGNISKNTIAFCGDLYKHVDGKKIKMFLSKHNIDIILLCNTKLQDIGTIIPIY